MKHNNQSLIFDNMNDLQVLVNESSSLFEILSKQGKKGTNDNIEQLKKELEAQNIDYSARPIKTIFEKIPIEEILVENSSYQSAKLKKRLIEEGLKEERCELCGIGNEWNGRPLTLQLHHINGNHTDNRIENIQILCPNCHSQTENYRGKKHKQHNHCADCGAEIALDSTWCPKCAAKHNRACKVDKADRPNKDELLKLIMTKPFTEIGRMYGVTDNAIRKWCKSMGLPSTKKELKLYNPEN